METIACIFSGIALLLSVAGYYINLKLYNQNKVFDEKIRAYGEIAKALNNVVNVLIENLHEGKLLREDKPKDYQDDLDDLADEIDEAIGQMHDVLIVNVLLLPKKIVEHLDGFARFIDSDENFDIFENPEKMDPLVDELGKRLENAIYIMREDMQSEKLNSGLQKRLTGNIGHKIFGNE
jgi:hypothetical protein